MRKGPCPKCGGKEIYVGQPSGEQRTMQIGLLTVLSLDYYVCTDCGYLETYVLSRDDRQKLREKWTKRGY